MPRKTRFHARTNGCPNKACWSCNRRWLQDQRDPWLRLVAIRKELTMPTVKLLKDRDLSGVWVIADQDTGTMLAFITRLSWPGAKRYRVMVRGETVHTGSSLESCRRWAKDNLTVKSS